ncbi:MAG: methyl-accepting chemotaxis protein [Syntrophomonas sp.]|nr:methyl-accepting chemotaxis protein [Syntrophomonas sp.]
MITKEKAAVIREIAPTLVNIIPGGAIFAESDTDKISWRLASDVFDIQGIEVGDSLIKDGSPYQAMQEMKITEEKVPRSLYGTRLKMKSIPIINDEEKAVGSFIFITPLIHPLVNAFKDFAPLMAEMFHEGTFLYITDLEKFILRQPSNKFDMPKVQIGNRLREGSTSAKAIASKKLIVQELDATYYGIPVLVMNYPIFEEDDPSQVIGTFGIILPRQTAVSLRDMSNTLTRNLEEVSTVIEEMAASSQSISASEQHLNVNIKDIFKLSGDINDVLGFIKQIADETKMLGLNAAIEAARAGDAGRGFGVVAEEIRKLSDQSKNTVSKIKGLTDEINQKVTETFNNSAVTLRATEEQAAATEEINASIEEITTLADQLDNIAREM